MATYKKSEYEERCADEASMFYSSHHNQHYSLEMKLFFGRRRKHYTSKLRHISKHKLVTSLS